VLKSGGERMNCFTWSSLMISEQWKAVCCRDSAWNRTGYCSVVKI